MSRPVCAVTEEEFWAGLRDLVREELAEFARLAPAQLLTLEETAELCRCSGRHIRRLRGEGLPAVMLGQSPRFERDAVLAWLRAQGSRGSGRSREKKP